MNVRIHKKFYSGDSDGFDVHCKKTYGNPTSKIIAKILNNVKAVKNLSVLMKQGFPGRWHWLSGDRKYQISADLIHPKRLIFLPEEESEDFDSKGILDNSKILGLIMFEIDDTHNE